MPITMSLLVDDGAPVNPMFFHDPPYAHPLLMPNALARDFADVCEEYGVRGKFSVLPMPCCLGSIEEGLNHVPPRHLAGFLKTVRERIAPRFDMTPEILTHLAAYRLTGGFRHVYEDEWVAGATVEEMTDYIAQDCPVTILTHWQSLYSDGTCAGLWGLERLLRRLRKRYGDDLAWTPCSQLAEAIT